MAKETIITCNMAPVFEDQHKQLISKNQIYLMLFDNIFLLEITSYSCYCLPG